MKKLSLCIKNYALCIIMSLYMVSCGGDNGGDDNNGGSGEEQPQEIAGYRYVDLGLPSGLKWAVHNMGATSPTEYGDYYAWGETATKYEFNYNECPINGVEIDDISGNPEYDAARANWGSTWRLPTFEEINELVDCCVCEWMADGLIHGINVVGPNGNSIFFPAAGYRNTTFLKYPNEYGAYWTSTSGSDRYGAHALAFDEDGTRAGWGNGRYIGRTIRPVSN